MVPLISIGQEFRMQASIIRETAERVFEERGERIDFKVGTMIEVPRAALVADRIAPHADFFSFGTNDLTQLTFGFSRDDIGDFLPVYLEQGILEADPFQTIDIKGVGRLVEMGTDLGRRAKPGLKVGICGEHGGDPKSIEFCDRIGMNYVSCSPYRVPVAKLVAAQTAIRNMREHAVMA
jgi:pyruvate,orthophosphate dikinase